MPNYSVAKREEAMDWMADYPGFGEMRWYSEVLGTEQVSFSWRRMHRYNHRTHRKSLINDGRVAFTGA